ncbi:MAG TPA: hypothetical protein VMU84_16380 [Thermoanaerobaculia bacterium]|nr:hypothetical protein [Thermoanaerobaculia bacterium]
MQFDEVLKTFSEAFDKEQIRYAVIGGLAVHAWGRSRLTKDVDLVVDFSARERVIQLAVALGYETLYVSDGYSNHAHADPRFGRVDFMYVRGETAERIFASATSKPVVGDVVAPVAAPEHLAMMKALSMKNVPHRALYEGEDVRVLLNVPGVDRDLVREFFRQHGLLGLYDAIDKAR